MARIIIVKHEIEAPALYGAAAALVAAGEGGRVFWPDARFDLARHPDAVQHVAEEGALIPSGLIWVDRIVGLPARPLAELTGRDVAAVALHPAFLSDPGAIERLRAAGAQERTITLDGDRFLDETGGVIGWRDRFGRVLPETPAPVTVSGPVIGLVGPEKQFLDVCPAPLAALADALEVEAPGGEIRFVDPRRLSAASLADLDGLVLPGGSDITLVAGQVTLAGGARAAGLPLIGLCLGMQSMATAMVRELPDWAGAEMAEVAPHSARHSVVRIETGEHRLGWFETRPMPGSRLAALLGDENAVAYNHRYRLAPQLHQALRSAGVRVSALGGAPGQGIADAIEAERGCCIGMQGHPELTSRPGRPHPLFTAFVAEAKAFASSRSARQEEEDGS